MTRVRLDQFDNKWYHPGRSKVVQGLWFFLGLPLLRSTMIPCSSFRRVLLRAFGATIGRGVVLKPGVRVKYPWLLQVGDHAWIGEDCWIDNLALVSIGPHACLSQGVYLCTGNHDWNDYAFALQVGPIHIRDGAWLAAKAIVAPGIEIGQDAVVGLGAVVVNAVSSADVVSGNPAKPIAKRRLSGKRT